MEGFKKYPTYDIQSGVYSYYTGSKEPMTIYGQANNTQIYDSLTQKSPVKLQQLKKLLQRQLDA